MKSSHFDEPDAIYEAEFSRFLYATNHSIYPLIENIALRLSRNITHAIQVFEETLKGKVITPEEVNHGSEHP
jgi:hypothetical protein